MLLINLTHRTHAILESVIGTVINGMIIVIANPMATILRWRGYGLMGKLVDKEPAE